mmetsp:Transcript_34782/g.84044  ORF Transcript_34782/g.84044 Transcript_34782/m.84044 type:complete len:220 (-) Transcript_34782:755-1414(-)
MVLFSQRNNFILRHSTVRKHANLLRDVIPRPGRPKILQCLSQLAPHCIDPLSHAHALLNEIICFLFAGKNFAHNPCTVPRRVGIARSNVHLELTQHTLCLLCVVGHHRQCPDSLSVQTKILRKRLDESNLMPVFHKHANCGGIFPSIPRCKPLVCTIKERQELLLHGYFANFLPLIQSRIHARRIVGASMQKDATPLRHGSHILDQVRKIQTASFIVII